MEPLYGAVEAGGTKFVCMVGTGPDDMREQTRFPTTSPEATLREAVAFFQAAEAKEGKLAAIGVASFGPVDVHADSSTFGFITSTPKPGWANVDIAGVLRSALDLKIGFDTDVNAAALAEWRWGAARGLDTFIYLTIGTGIGGGGMVNGRLMHGLVHPEMGHVRIPHDLEADPFAGTCPFHGDCLEGLASGPAMAARWLQPAEQLPVNHPGWTLEAGYLALALVNFICTLSPQRIVIGGGVMSSGQLFPVVRQRVLELLNNYVRARQLLDGIDDYIVAPWLGQHAGVLGALALAERINEGRDGTGQDCGDGPTFAS
jgi:fructokinase